MADTPAVWVERLDDRLNQRWYGQMLAYDAFFEGDHGLSFATAPFREAFGSTFGPLADNWCPIVVQSSAERLKVQGFRFGDQQEADKDAWDIWQENNLDAASGQVHVESIKLGEAYWLVEPGDPPRITAEHPSQVVVAWEPGDRRKRVAAWKRWTDYEDTYANLYLPDAIYKYELAEKGILSGLIKDKRLKWKLVDTIPNPLGVVPIVPVCNEPSMLRGGQSDLHSVIPIQKAIDKLTCDLLISSEYQAFPQRVLIGMDMPRDEQGRVLRASQIQASQSRLWNFGDPEVRVDELSAADLKNYTEAIGVYVRHLTAQTRVPPHYILGDIVNASGDALKAAETGLVAKVRMKMQSFEEAHEETMRLAFKALGDDKKAEATDAETIWRDPESRSQAEVVDAATKKQTLGVPFEILMEDIGYSPQQIDRIMSLREAEKLLADALAPPVPSPGVPPANGQVPPGAVPPPAAKPMTPPVAG